MTIPQICKDVWTYDGSSWTQQTSPSVTWSGMKDHEAQVFDGKIWILGGNDNGSRIKKYFSFNGTSWSQDDQALFRTGPKEAVWSAMNLIIIYGWLEEIMERVGQLT